MIGSIKSFSGILSSLIQNESFSSWVRTQVTSDIVDFALDYNPTTGFIIILSYLADGYIFSGVLSPFGSFKTLFESFLFVLQH